MDLATSLKVAVRSLRRASLRSTLATLGIIIGVAAVVAVVSVGNGARANVERTLANLEANQLRISGDPKRGHARRGWRWGLPPGDGLTIEDYEEIRREIRGLAASTVRVYGIIARSSANDMLPINALGVDVQGFQVLARRIVRGTTFGETDVKTAASVCVIPKFLAQQLFGDADPLGRSIQIADSPFTVLGVMDDDLSRQSRLSSESGDTTAYIPYTSLMRRLDRAAKVTIVLRATYPAELGRIQLEVSDLLERRRGTRIANFVTGNVSEVVRRQTDASRTLTILLGTIGGISLIVGGIGIMNIMLVSVAERNREIGIRMAIGTRGRDIMWQFVIEAVLLSICGGAVGVAAGTGVAHLMARLSDWPTVVTSGSILLAFSCSAVVGVFFGYYPARRAAELDPIQALHID